MKNQNVYYPEDVLIPHFGKEAKLVGVEIGVAGSAGSSYMLYSLPNLKIYCIDPWKHIKNGMFEAGLPQEVLDNGYKITKSKLSKYGDRAVILKKSSDEAVNDIPNELDFVHIDGDHQYEQVVKDINNYLPKIRKGGIISGHDHILREGVDRAVDELLKEYKIHYGDDFLWWVYK